ncbi:MAG: hypothetical protein AB7N91_09175 [Candidatus Tectimicrobiota bacterium]
MAKTAVPFQHTSLLQYAGPLQQAPGAARSEAASLAALSAAEAVSWLAASDLDALGAPHRGEVRLQTAAATLTLTALPMAGVMSGTVAVPRGLPGLNVHTLIPAGAEPLAPLSGQAHLTGMPVQVTMLTPYPEVASAPAVP